MKNLLDGVVREHIEKKRLDESRSGPSGFGVSEFEKVVQNKLSAEYDSITPAKSTYSLDVSRDFNQEFAEQLEDSLTEILKELNIDEEEINEPPIASKVVPTVSSEPYEGQKFTEAYESVGDHTSSRPLLYVVINEEVYGWKISSAGGATGTIRAAQYELVICTAYNLFVERNDESNPLVNENGEFDTSRENLKTLTEEDIRPYVKKAKDGADDSDVEKALNTEALDVSMSVIQRNSELQDIGDFARQYGAASASTSSQYTGQDATPKTDFYFDQSRKVSLKKKGTEAQYMSGQKEDAKAVLEAAIYYCNNFDEQVKEELTEDVVNKVEKRFNEKIKRDGDRNVSSVKDTVEGIYIEMREDELVRKIEDDLSRENGEIKVETLSGDDLTISSQSNIEAIVSNHVKAELKYYKLKNRRGNWQSRLIKDYTIDARDFKKRVDRNFGRKDIDRLDEMAKNVINSAIDNTLVEDTIKKQVEGNTEMARAIRKWVLFEASTGLYKFQGTTNSSPYEAIGSAKKPVADTILKFSPTTNGSDFLTDINNQWVEKNSKGINIRVSFKTRSSGIAQTLRVEGEEMSFEKIIKEEKERMFEDITNHVKHRKKLYEAEQKIGKREILSEDIFGIDFGEMIKNVIEKGKSIAKYVKDRFVEYVRSTMNRVYDLIRQAGEYGIDRIMDLFGIEIEEVQIDLIQV